MGGRVGSSGQSQEGTDSVGESHGHHLVGLNEYLMILYQKVKKVGERLELLAGCCCCLACLW